MKNIYINRIIILILFNLLFVGCFVPKPVQEKGQQCELATKKLTLEYPEGEIGLTLDAIMSTGLVGCHTPECLLVPLGILAVPVGSFIVSGSIVVLGNTIHWIERQGRCEDSAIRAAVNDLVTAVTKAGGKAIQTEQELINWLKQQLQIDSDS